MRPAHALGVSPTNAKTISPSINPFTVFVIFKPPYYEELTRIA
jgi:hypothetical protein